MAIDTRAKRASALNMLMPFRGSPVVVASGISEVDRVMSLFMYVGIDISEQGGISYPPTVSADEVPFLRGLTEDPVNGHVYGQMGPEA